MKLWHFYIPLFLRNFHYEKKSLSQFSSIKLEHIYKGPTQVSLERKKPYTLISTISCISSISPIISIQSVKKNHQNSSSTKHPLSLSQFSASPSHFTAPCFPLFLLSSSSSSSTMASKFSHVLFIILWLSLFLLLFRELYNSKSNTINTKQFSTVTAYSSSSSSHYYHALFSRKVLASNFDFTPFLNHHDHRQQHLSPHKKKQERSEPAADQSEIDPRYGVEKRRVPTGPNPLHHWWVSHGDQWNQRGRKIMVSGELASFVIALYDVFPFYFFLLFKSAKHHNSY